MNTSDKEIWQTHSMKFLESAFRSERQEIITHADGYGKKSSDCGDTIEFFLMIEEDRLSTISYALKGCLNINACANAVIDLLEGKRIQQAWEFDPKDVVAYLESLPQNHFHCAQLATDALRLALADARDKQKSPWKKLYQKHQFS